MSKFSSLLVLALAADKLFALPTEPVHVIEKRQAGGLSGLLGGLSSVGSMGPLLSAVASNKLGKFMGEPEATEALTALAKTMGATRDSPGGLRAFTLQTSNPGYGPVKDPAGVTLPRKQVLESKTGIPGAKAVKIRYGPYSVPNMKKKNGLGEEGMLSNYPDDKLQKPCDDKCTIIGMEAGLEYPDGKNANINTGMWLHHIVLFNKGPGREDPTCSHRDISLPHANIGATPRNSERIFASGNERSINNLPAWGVKDAGYKLKPTDEFAALIELMNENMDDKVVYFTMTYDIVEGHPYKDDVKVVWFDVRQCGTSEVNPPKGQTKFTLSYNWTSTLEADVIGAIGHGHDGAAKTNMLVDGKETCENIALYGTKKEFVQENAMGHHAAGATKHISDMKPCYGDKFPLKQMKKGQVWTHKVAYDFDANNGMKHEDGSFDEVMGIEIVFIRLKGQ